MSTNNWFNFRFCICKVLHSYLEIRLREQDNGTLYVNICKCKLQYGCGINKVPAVGT